MSLFTHPDEVGHSVAADREHPDAAQMKRPPRWSVGNWPVRWKVVAIALVPMALAVAFGGLRVSAALADAGKLRLAADRAEMIPAITNYMSALGNALVAASADGDAQGAKKNYENRKYELQSRLGRTDAATDVRSGVTTLVEGGQALLDRVLSNSIGLRDEVTGYAPILLTAEDAINGSVRIDNDRMRAQTEGLSRAVGARGQMMMQELLVNRGGELPEPELRTSMMTLAGTEPSTLFGMSEVLGVDSPEAKTLQQQLVTRMAIMSDPESVLPDNPELRDSIRRTDEVAAQVISDTTGSVTESVEDQADARRDAAIRDLVLTLAAIVIAVAVVWLVARSLVRPLRILRDSALRVAHTDLEDEIARVRGGDEREPAPLPIHTTEEVGQVAHAVDELHAQALLLAGDEARLRGLVNEMFETMSRRNRSLVDQQLTLIDALERDEGDPDRLDSLFRLDHLAARMRRNGANLLVLAGAAISHEKGRSVPLATALSAAVSEVEGYHRVETAMVPDATLTGVATGDTIHLLAELIDNALRYSPPTAPVRVTAELVQDGGVLVEIADSGLGMTDADLRMGNTRLGSGGDVTPDNARHMGLFVVSRLANRHGIRVRLAPAVPGITAGVYLPPSLLVGGIGADLPAPVAAVPAATPAVFFAGQRSAADTAASAEQPAVSLLPQRAPGSSGITGVPARPPQVAGEPPRQKRALPRPWWEPADDDISAPAEPAPADEDASRVPQPDSAAAPERGDRGAAEEPPPPEDPIYQGMLSEWLVDPYELGRSPDLDWKTVWDHGWSAAAEVENVPVVSHTDHGLPVREPGVRLVPGSVAAGAASQPGVSADQPAEQPEADPQRRVPSNGVAARGAHRAPERDPDAIRASISSHFGGVRAGRSQARDHPAAEPDRSSESE